MVKKEFLKVTIADLAGITNELMEKSLDMNKDQINYNYEWELEIKKYPRDFYNVWRLN